MATRSTIAKVEADGSVTSIYCHWDGYPSHNGKILLENYQDEAKVDDLLAGGSLSILGKCIGEKHPFDDHQKDDKYKDMCLYYGRDREEDGVEPEKHICLAEYLMSDREEWTYLWTPDGWKFCGGKNKELYPLTHAACE